MSPSAPEALRDRYIDLLEAALTHTLYRPMDIGSFPPRNRLTKAFFQALRSRGLETMRIVANPEEMRETGRDWPVFAQTMVGSKRLRNVRDSVETVLAENVPGDFIETGVWRGGSSIFMRGLLEAHGVQDRKVWVCDSFEGLPAPDLERNPQDRGGIWHTAERLAVSLAEVKGNFERYSLLDDQVEFVKGYFSDTLHRIEHDRWSIIRLDGDMYGSTIDALNALYPNLEVGGFLIIDDYEIPACRAAITDYRRDHGIDDEIVTVDWTGAYWRKGS